MDILILSGFLGSGKTSLLVALADELVRRTPGRSIAVLENEAGTVGIDDAVVAGAGLRVRALLSGCVCCTLKGELLAATLDIQRQIAPDLLIVEASGVAAPRIVAGAFGGYPEKIDSITLAVLLDLTRLDVLAGYSFYYVRECIESADILVLNKLDAMGHDGVEHALAEVRGVKPDVLALPVSVKEATGISAIADALEARLGEGTRHAADAVDRQDKLAGAATYALMENIEWPGGTESGSVVVSLRDMVQGMADDLKSAGCGLIGHIKALLKSGEERCLVRTVSAGRTPDIDNTLPKHIGPAQLIVDIIVYGFEKQELNSIVTARFKQFRS